MAVQPLLVAAGHPVAPSTSPPPPPSSLGTSGVSASCCHWVPPPRVPHLHHVLPRHPVLRCPKRHLFKVHPHDLGTNPPRSVLCATARALSATASFGLHSTPSKPIAADAITHLRERAGCCVPSPRGHPTLWQLPAALLSAKHGTLLTAR